MQRQIKSCTHCRQHKVKCDAMKFKDHKCTRCHKYGLECIIDQHFKPRRGGQVEILREHLAEMQKQLLDITQKSTPVPGDNVKQESQHAAKEEDTSSDSNQQSSLKRAAASSSTNKDQDTFEEPADPAASLQLNVPLSKRLRSTDSVDNLSHYVKEIEKSVAERMAAGGRLKPVRGPYKLATISLEESDANRLYDFFMRECEPYMPMFESSSAGELYARSEFLFWSVMTVGAQGERTSELYVSLVGPMKELAAKKCLLETTRSSSVVQALLVLCTWPLPSEKMLEDMSSRYASLAYSMGVQLGIHRGKFIYEFSRNQQLMPNAVKWRSRTWVQTYITQQMISASTGIPAAMPVDHIIDHALHDDKQPLSPRTVALLKISLFYSKLVSIMGSSINTQDGLMEPNSRCPTLDLLKTDLSTMFPPTESHEDPVIEVSILYARLLLDSFAFLPDTPLTHQSPFIIDAFQACTRIVTVVCQMVGKRKIVEMPGFIRNPCSLAALFLFRMQLLPNLPEQYVSSARESIVTVHHMYRNLHPSWQSPNVSNDISRVAKLLESLNHVMITHPELLHSKRVMRHMRSHLTFSIFYEFLYIIHEAKRRNAKRANLSSGEQSEKVEKNTPGFEESSPDQLENSPHEAGTISSLIHSVANTHHRDLNPLPLFSDINLDTYISNTVISPNGTTMTTLSRADGLPVDQTVQLIQQHQHELQPHVHNSYSHPNQHPSYQHQHQLSHSSHLRTPSSSQQTSSTEQASVRQQASSSEQPNLQTPPLEVNDSVAVAFEPKEPVNLGANIPIDANYIQRTDPNADISTLEEGNSDMNNLFVGLDWMNTEGDDFLGWMMPREE